MAGSTSLQIPTVDSPVGPSRQYPSSARPVSVTVHSSPAGSSPSASRKQRASHTVVSSTNHQQQSNGASNGRHHDDNSPPYTDVYNHPAALAYASAHPRRTIPKFGPYLLLQTLGEGEFGKVKLGLHSTWGEEVAVKLIRRGNVDSAVRMSKVEREIEVLRVRVFTALFGPFFLDRVTFFSKKLSIHPVSLLFLDPQTPKYRPFVRCHRNRQVHRNHHRICFRRRAFRPHSRTPLSS